MTIIQVKTVLAIAAAFTAIWTVSIGLGIFLGTRWLVTWLIAEAMP
jgi:hypothetical protein